MAVSPSVNCYLKRLFILYSGCSKKNKLIANYCRLKQCNNFYKRNFTTNYYKLGQSIGAFSTKCEQDFSNEKNLDEEESDDELVLNNGDDSDEEHEQITNQIEEQKIYADNNHDNYKNSAKTTENMKTPYPHYIRKKKKFKYDSDLTILYEDICNLPQHFFSFPPTEEEIKHVNSGGADYGYGNYNYIISFSGNNSNTGGSNKHSQS